MGAEVVQAGVAVRQQINSVEAKPFEMPIMAYRPLHNFTLIALQSSHEFKTYGLDRNLPKKYLLHPKLEKLGQKCLSSMPSKEKGFPDVFRKSSLRHPFQGACHPQPTNYAKTSCHTWGPTAVRCWRNEAPDVVVSTLFQHQIAFLICVLNTSY